MSNQWERPNWRNPEAYKMPENMSLHQWYWQFLRRRREYVSDYWKHADETYEIECKIHEHLGIHAVETIFKPEHEDFECSIPTAYFKYNIVVCPNPRNNSPRSFCYTSDKTISMTLGDAKNPELPIHLLPHQAAITFSLQLPISQQIESAQKMLLSWQKFHLQETNGRAEAVQFRRHITKWPNYLRALDASDNGETLEEIGLVLSAACLSEDGLENHLFTVGSEKLKRTGQSVLAAARSVQNNFPF